MVSGANDKNEEDNQEETVDQEKDKEKEVKITLYDNGIPEKCAEKTVTEMFKDWMEQKPTWLYRDAPRFRLSLFLECLGEILRKSVKSIYPINSFKGVVILPKSNVRF